MPERPKLIVANFKKSGTNETVEPWIKTIAPFAQGLLGLANIVVCPPYPYLEKTQFFIKENKCSETINVGAQNFDSVDDTNVKQTSQITAKMIADFAEYVILGHSEVRAWNHEQKSYNGDTPDEVNKKIKLAQEAKLSTIVCISDVKAELELLKNSFPDYEGIIAYEPLGSVGTGSATNPNEANLKAIEILKRFPKARVIYGGSVDGKNAQEFFNQSHLSGVLVGNKSSNPEFFKNIVQAFPINSSAD